MSTAPRRPGVAPPPARPARRRRRLAAAALLALLSAATTAPPASAAVGATLVVAGTQWGESTCFLGAVEGNTRFDARELRDMGVNTYRIYGGVSRWERSDDDGTYGSPSISEVKADPDRVDWAAWDAAMTSPPRGSDYSWSTPSDAIWQGNARTLFQELEDNGIRPVVTLRDQDNFDGNTWLASPPTSTADWNEWWEHAFATVYWLNVRNDYRVDDWEIHNEPDLSAQGWKGTQEQYYDFVRYTSDAIRHVYETYLPGRTPRLHAGATLSGSAWPEGILAEVRDEFDVVNIHNYSDDVTTYNQRVHRWMDRYGAGERPLWVSEWGTFTQDYDTLDYSLTVLQNMVRGSRPGLDRVHGSTIFAMYDWQSAEAGENFQGVVGADGDPTWTYHSFRMGSRALQGCRATYETTASTSALTAITTRSANGDVHLLAVNRGGSELTVDADLSALATGGTGARWRHDATHADARDGTVALVDGRATTSIPAGGAVLVSFTGVTAPTGPAFLDTFEDGDSSGWTTAGGTWQVQQPPGQSREYVKSGPGEGLALAGSSAWTDYRVQAYVKPAAGATGAAVVARARDATHFYQLELKNSGGTRTWGIWKNDGGTWTRLASGPYGYADGVYQLLRLDVEGSSLTASVSSDFGASFRPLGSATDGAYPAGRIGVRGLAGTASFDDVRVSGL